MATCKHEGNPALVKHNLKPRSVINGAVKAVGMLLKQISLDNDITACVESHQRLIHLLTSTATVTEQTESQTREVVDYLLPFLQSSLASHAATQLLQLVPGSPEFDRVRLVRDENIQNGLRSGILSCIIKVAVIHYMLGNYEASAGILSDAEMDFSSHCVNFCDCKGLQRDPEKYWHNDDEGLPENVSSGTTAPLHFLKSRVSTCVTFLPSEREMTPTALRQEMFKSERLEAAHVTQLYSEWRDWCVMDAVVCLRYMQYLVYDRTGDVGLKQLAAEKLEQVINTDSTLGHKETALNLLGSIYTQQNNVIKKSMCFVQSLIEEPVYNAVTRHMSNQPIRRDAPRSSGLSRRQGLLALVVGVCAISVWLVIGWL